MYFLHGVGRSSDLVLHHVRSSDLVLHHVGTIVAAKKFLTSKKKLGTKYWLKRFNLSVFSMNVVDVWLSYQVFTGTADTQADFYSYLSEDIIYNTYDRFMMRSAEGRRRNIVDSDDETFDDDNPLFERTNGAPICGIYLHVTPTKKRMKKSYGTETQYLLQGECKLCQKKTTHVCSDCADTDAVKNEMWVCHPKTNRSCFSQHVHSTHDL